MFGVELYTADKIRVFISVRKEVNNERKQV